MKNRYTLAVLITLSIFLAASLNWSYKNSIEQTTDSINILNNDLNGKVYITEISPNNQSTIQDETLNFSPYIEIYNENDFAVDLGGFYLSDDFSLPKKWTFPNITLSPNEYLIIFADKKDLYAKYPHTNFKLNKQANTIIFSSNNGEILSQITSSQCVKDMTLSKIGEEYVYCQTGSPYEESKDVILDVEKYIKTFESNSILYSHKPGIYANSFLLELKTDSPYVDIRYTLDGRNPDKNSNIYTKPINITSRDSDKNIYAKVNTTYEGSFVPDDALTKKATVVKAQCFLANTPIGEIYTNTFFVDKNGKDLYSLPVISLTTEPDNLFSGSDGIYVVGDKYINNPPESLFDAPANYKQRTEDYIKPCLIEYFEDGSLCYKQNLSVAIFGGWSRALQKKSLKLSPIDESDININYNFFGDLYDINDIPITSFENIILRSGGTDAENAIFRDAMFTGIMEDILDVQAAFPIVLFLNGEYWGIHIIREDINKAYIKNHYNIEKQDIVYLKDYMDSDNLDDVRHYKDYMFFAMENDLSIIENYEFIKNGLDLQNMIEYWAAEIYLVNKDFPHHNVALWRNRTQPTDDTPIAFDDGRYRYILFDTDYGFNLYGNQLEFNMFEFLFESDYEHFERPTAIIKALFENAEFRDMFISTFCDRLNYTLNAKNIEPQIDYWTQLLAPEIESNINRYGVLNSDINEWYNEIDKMKIFAEQRPNIVFEHMAEFFDENVVEFELTTSKGGKIDINDRIQIDSCIKGNYLTNTTITLTAIPDKGYEFIRWSNGSNDITISQSFSKPITQLNAEFSRIEDYEEN